MAISIRSYTYMHRDTILATAKTGSVYVGYGIATFLVTWLWFV